jgi:hypothetical protein
MAYTPQPETHGVMSTQAHPDYDQFTSEYYSGFFDGQSDGHRLNNEEAHRAWNHIGNEFIQGRVGYNYWYGYQCGNGIAKGKPGYPGARNFR